MTAVDRANPMIVSAATMYSGNDGGSFSVREFDSTDGGTSWLAPADFSGSDDPNATAGGATLVNDQLTGGTRVDPSLAYDASGNLFLSYIYLWTDGGGTHGDILVFERAAGSTTFSNRQLVSSVFPGGRIDKDMITTGLDPVSGRQAIYVGYFDGSVRVSGWQEDAAGNLLASSLRNVAVPGSNGNYAQPAVDPAGNLFVAWNSIPISPPLQVGFSRALGGLFGQTSQFDAATTLPSAKGTEPVLDVDRRTGDLFVVYTDPYSVPGAYRTMIIKGTNSAGSISWGTPVGVDRFSSGSAQIRPWVSVDDAARTVDVLYYTNDEDVAPDTNSLRPRLSSLTESTLATLSD